MKPPPRQDTNGQRDIHWVDVDQNLLFYYKQWLTRIPQGLRGIASVLVVTSHLARAFTPSLLSPTNGDREAPSYAQLPILRLAAQGPPWVALFFLLTGYVNAIKPIKQARNGSIDFALSDLASSCFRRTGRLVLPATIATILSWIMCELGGYKHGRISDATWIRDTSPDPSKSISEAVHNLWYNLFTTWSKGANKYDAIQWTLPFLLKGSMLVYMALLATIRTLPIYRLSILLGLFFFSWASRDCELLSSALNP